MRILITGALGMIGYSLCEKLLKLGHNVIGIDYLRSVPQIPSTSENTFYKHYRHNLLQKQSNFAYIDLNLSALETPTAELSYQTFMKTLPYCECVVHLADICAIDLNKKNEENARVILASNMASTTAALEIAAVNKAKFIYASSSCVYGNNSFSREDAKLTPLNAYAQSKVLGEQLCEYYQKNYHLHVVCARLFTTFGRFNRPDMLAHKILDSIYMGRDLELYNEGQSMRSFVFADDIASILIYIMENKVFYGIDMLNIGSCVCVSTKEFVEMFESVSGKKANIILSQKTVIPDFIECNDQKLVSDFAPIFTEYPEAIEKTISSYLDSFHKLPSLNTPIEGINSD